MTELATLERNETELEEQLKWRNGKRGEGQGTLETVRNWQAKL